MCMIRIDKKLLRDLKALSNCLEIPLMENSDKKLIPLAKSLKIFLDQIDTNKTMLFEINRENYKCFIEYKEVKDGLEIYEFKEIYLPENRN